MNRCLFVVTIGFFLTVLGLVLVLSINNIFILILNQTTPLSPGSSVYEIWKKPPVSLTMSFYFFNCTNTEQLKDKNFKPNFEEIGPYTFREYNEKVNITWNANHTVTYRQIRHWYFDAENSNGTVKDQIITVNIPVLGAVHATRYWSSFTIFSLSAAMKVANSSIWMNPTVEDYLFNGLTDPVISLAAKLPIYSTYISEIADNMAVLHRRNGSNIRDGVFNMDTGAGNISGFGSLRYWNYKNNSASFESSCGEIRGSASGLFPPGLTKGQSIEVFHPDACRYYTFDYVREAEVNGIMGNYYEISNKVYDNGTTFPDSECNCGGQCLRQGVMNGTKCRSGLPSFTSAPHFLGADPYYLNQVIGLNPDPSRHTSYFIIEPITGVPLEGDFCLQINVFLQRNPGIALYKDVPTIMFPLLWFEERATLPLDLSAALGMLLKVPIIGLCLGIGLLILGVIILGGTILHYHSQRIKTDKIYFRNGILNRRRSHEAKHPDCKERNNTSEMIGFLSKEAKGDETERRKEVL